MARKKRKEGKDPSKVHNPYFGKFEDESKMPEKPFLTWILVVPGLLLGGLLGFKVENLFLGLVFGAVMGIAIGSLIDKWWADRKGKKQAKEDE